MKRGIDTSFVQRDRGPYDFARVKASGKVDFAYARVSYGSNPADDDGMAYVDAHDGAKAHGIPFGGYHFFLFGQDGLEQAQHFLQQIDAHAGENAPMVDVEEGSGTTGSLQENIERLSTFNAAIEKAIGRPLIYTNDDTWTNTMGDTDAFAGHGLWVAQSVDPKSGLFGGWTTWKIWQYGLGDIDGIVGQVDLDLLNGEDLSIIAR